jgi:hypothetical protein
MVAGQAFRPGDHGDRSIAARVALVHVRTRAL